jgi:preprotein translocase subunit SecE
VSTVIQKKDKPAVADKPESKATKFVKESYVEVVRKTSWPSKADLVKFTGVVLGTILVVAVYLGVLDLVFGKVIGRLLR